MGYGELQYRIRSSDMGTPLSEVTASEQSLINIFEKSWKTLDEALLTLDLETLLYDDGLDAFVGSWLWPDANDTDIAHRLTAVDDPYFGLDIIVTNFARDTNGWFPTSQVTFADMDGSRPIFMTDPIGSDITFFKDPYYYMIEVDETSRSYTIYLKGDSQMRAPVFVLDFVACIAESAAAVIGLNIQQTHRLPLFDAISYMPQIFSELGNQ